MKKNSFKLRLAFPLSALVLVGACASKPEGYSALPAGSDISTEMDKTEASLTAARESNIQFLAPQSFERAAKAFNEAKEDRAGTEDNKEILKDISLAQAHLRLAEKSSQISEPALSAVVAARNAAIDAEADRVLTNKLKEVDEDLKKVALEIEDDGNLNDARDQGPDLSKQYAELRTEALEKGGRSREQRELKQENQSLRAQNTVTTEALLTQGAQNQDLTGKLGARANQDAKVNAVREKFSREEADVLINRDNEVVIRLKGLQFPSNRSDIPAASLPLLSKLDQALAEFPNSEVTIEGHTDSVGAKELNQSLSQKRAEAVSGYLTSRDTNLKIEALGKGLEEPIASNKSASGRAQNRRIDVVVKTGAENSL